jgi:hypothetical protein
VRIDRARLGRPDHLCERRDRVVGFVSFGVRAKRVFWI